MKQKKVLSLVISILTVLSVGLYAFAAESDYEWTVTDGEAMITAYNGSSTEVNIPDSLGGYPVTAIGNSVFEYKGLTVVTIPDTVREIGERAFVGNYMPSVDLPSELKVIKSYAFEQSVFLTEIEVPYGVTTIESFAFANSDRLKSVTLPDTVNSIGDAAFHGDFALEKVNIPEGVKSIEMYTFFSCRALESINIPESVEFIGEAAFKNCFSLREINLPSKITSIEDGAFAYCESLTQIVLHNGISSIGEIAFDGCAKLEKIVIMNAECEIFDNEYTIDAGAVIYGAENSTAKAYAEKYSRKFEIIPDDLIGDINFDMVVNAADARLALRISAKLLTPSQLQKERADVNGDGKVTSSDARMILRVAAKIDSFN